MDSVKLASGDNVAEVPSSPRAEINMESNQTGDSLFAEAAPQIETAEINKIEINNQKPVVPDLLENNEIKIKERIAECRSIIESLKLELSAEKTKAAQENWSKTKLDLDRAADASPAVDDFSVQSSRSFVDIPYSTEFYSASVDSKLSCDENLIQYEKQLQKYQKTLNLAQIEKRNVIRKQMLAKAFKLKLLEIENQCNTELIRVKQSMQCLEPLKLVADSWKNNDGNSYNLDNYELIPRYPEVSSSLAAMKEALEAQASFDKSPRTEKNELPQPET